MEVEILGHKAKIERVSNQLSQFPWQPVDCLIAWLKFDEAVGSTISFAIELPAKKYADREALLYHIRWRGEEALRRSLERDEAKDEERKTLEDRGKVLDALAAEAQKLID